MVQKISAYFAICKPKVVVMMLMTAWAGMLLVPESVPINALLMLQALVGIGLMSFSGGAFNHIFDVKNDEKMHRTSQRPLVKNAISIRSAWLWATFLALSGFCVLFYINAPTAFLSLLAFVGYALVYTCFLKYRTAQNIVIGGLFGALPPLLGWVAMTGSVDAYPLVLVLVVFLWTPPHFWVLAVAKNEEYKVTKVPTFPSVYGFWLTGVHMVLYIILLFVVGIFPYLMGENSGLYLVLVSGLNACFLGLTVRVILRRFLTSDCMFLFLFSLFYIPVFFLLILVDHHWLNYGF